MECFCKENSTAEVSGTFQIFKTMQGWVCKPAVYWKCWKIFQIPSKYLLRSSIAVALQPVNCKSVTLVKRELLKISRRATSQRS